MAPGSRKRNKNRVVVPIVEIESSGDEIEEIDPSEDSDAREDVKPLPSKRRYQPTMNQNKRVKVDPLREDPEDSSDVQWIDKYAPKTVAQISINPTKLKQVKEVLSDMIFGSKGPKLLILTGPSGSSKSTTVKLLAEELIGGLKKNSFDQNSYTEFFDTISAYGTGQQNQFEEFLNDSKYKIGSNLSLILIEDLPNIFHEETLIKFRRAINQWVYTDAKLPPLVLCLTELEYSGNSDRFSFNIENNLTSDTLLGKNITSLPQVRSIKFNSIANRFIKKTMDSIIKQERDIFKRIPQEEIRTFLDSIMKIGDVRSAIANLQMWARNYVRELQRTTKATGTEEKLIDTSKFLVSSFHRENQINLFHAIGKILFSSTNFSQYSNQDYLSVEQVLADFHGSNFPLLNLSLLENYTMYKDGQYSLEIASAISDDLSINDTVSNDISSEIGIRSTRAHLRLVSSTENYTHKQRTKFTRHFKMVKQYNRTFEQIRQYQIYIDNCRHMFQDLNLVDGYYLPLIYNRRNRTRFRYNRLGGTFREIYADDELPVEDDSRDQASELDQFQIDVQNKIAQLRNDDVDQLNEDNDLSDPISEDETDEDDFLDDPELDGLISRGQI